MTKKISSVAEVISDKIVGNMIIAKYFCQRTVKLQNVWRIFIKYSVDNLQHHFQDTFGLTAWLFRTSLRKWKQQCYSTFGQCSTKCKILIGQSRNGSYFVACSLATLAEAMFLTVSIQLMFGSGLQLFLKWNQFSSSCHSCFYPNSLSKHSWQYGFSPCSLNVPLFSCFRQKLQTKCSGWNLRNMAVIQRPEMALWHPAQRLPRRAW